MPCANGATSIEVGKATHIPIANDLAQISKKLSMNPALNQVRKSVMNNPMKTLITEAKT
jgi:hypothetical protein